VLLVLIMLFTYQDLSEAALPLEKDSFQYTGCSDTASPCTMRRMTFPCSGEVCEGWLFLPTAARGGGGGGIYPLIVMGCGMGLQKDFGLDRFAKSFNEVGHPVFAFDYRGFGGSSGLPRNLVQGDSHVEDYLSALRFIGSSSGEFEVLSDGGSEVVLWGASYAGGHVLKAAQRLSSLKERGGGFRYPRIRKIISIVPYLNAWSSLRSSLPSFSLGLLCKLPVALTWDLLSLLTFGIVPAPWIPLTAEPGHLALMNTPGSKTDYLSLIPYPGGCGRSTKTSGGDPCRGWRNTTPIRSLWYALNYVVEPCVMHVSEPVLLIGTELDTLTPTAPMKRLCARKANFDCVFYNDKGHFEVYQSLYDETVSRMLQFLRAP
jgi:uncharacterized protein